MVLKLLSSKMYPQVFEIRVDDEGTKYYGGQVVEGRVILVLHKEKVVRGILIRLVGKGNVYWDTGIKHTNVFSESEVYVNNVVQLMVPEDGRQTVLHPGAYEYYFKLSLPANIPSSLESQHCVIRYYLEAAIQRPWKEDQTIESSIIVNGISDLNNDPKSSEPASIQREKFVGFNICQTGPISLNFMIGKTGFVPGEFLQFGVEIRNTSGTKINRVHVSLKRVSVSLKRRLSCRAKGETKSSHDKILQVNGASADVAGYLLWQSNFEIPLLLPPSELFGCNIINIQYYVEIKLVLDKWADVKFNMPITIGTIPFQSKDALPNSGSFSCKGTPTKSKSVRNSVVASPSPITHQEFKYGDWSLNTDQHLSLGSAPVLNQAPTAGLIGNGFAQLPPLDLSYFQLKHDKSPQFKYYEDCDCEFSYPTGMKTSKSQEIHRPPRPHSNPGHFWERSAGYWESDDE